MLTLAASAAPYPNALPISETFIACSADSMFNTPNSFILSDNTSFISFVDDKLLDNDAVSSDASLPNNLACENVIPVSLENSCAFLDIPVNIIANPAIAIVIIPIGPNAAFNEPLKADTP